VAKNKFTYILNNAVKKIKSIIPILLIMGVFLILP